INKKAIAFSYKATRGDRAVLIATFLSTLFLELEMAVYVGVILSIALFLKKVANPQISIVTPRVGDNKMSAYQKERSCPQIAIFEISGSLFFGAIEEMEKKLSELRTMKQNIYLIRMRAVRILDATGAHALERFLKDTEINNEKVIFTNVSESVRRTIVNCGLLPMIGEENITDDSTDAIRLAVLKYADRGICKNCTIKVFNECEESSR
ncbi:MAG: STAS domain-containing protein, partial [Candidatus Magasanikbacteria bacterium]|nr:STAS domain-containing protein [Candidatus Magasanikbacteria bacterium]